MRKTLRLVWRACQSWWQRTPSWTAHLGWKSKRWQKMRHWFPIAVAFLTLFFLAEESGEGYVVMQRVVMKQRSDSRTNTPKKRVLVPMFKKWLVWWMRAKNQAAHGWQCSLMKSCKWCLPDELSSVSDVFLWKIALIDSLFGNCVESTSEASELLDNPGRSRWWQRRTVSALCKFKQFHAKAVLRSVPRSDSIWDPGHTQIQFSLSVK